VIRSLEIDNFRCFKSLRLPNVRRFTLIVGKNGSGKTALLESLFVAGGGSPEIYIRTSVWRGRDALGFTPDSVLPLFEDFFYKFDSGSGLRVSFRDSFGEQREVRIAVRSPEVIDLPFESKVSEAASSQDLTFIWKTPKGERESKVEITREGVRIAQPSDVYPIVFLNQFTFGSARDTADRWSVISAENREGPIEEAVRSLFPEVQGLSVLSSAGVPTIHVGVRGLNRKIPAGLLSAGVNKFIAILVGIAFARRGVVLIDEIENGLYYGIDTALWEAISNYAYSNDTQIIATTHSKEFLQAIAPLVDEGDRDYALLRIERKNGDITIDSFSGKEFGGAVERGFEVR
jgi:hypothetical protein